MKSSICPYLGLRDDPSTVLDFPSEGNFCHRAQSVPAVGREYQRAVCLSADHVTCPLFLGAGEEALPAAFTAPQPRSPQPARLLWVAVPVLLIIAGLALRALWRGLETRGFFSRVNDSEENGAFEPPSSTFPPEEASQESNSEYSPFQRWITPGSPNPSLIPCKQPAGWIPYTVKPTDSLFRISLVYGVSIADLQMVNCLEVNTVLKPGQTILVPGSPTATVVLSPTPSPTSTRRPYVPPSEPTRGSRPQPTQEPPPGQPPTNTPVPPTEPPPPPTSTQRPPPTATQPPPPTQINPTPTSAPPLP
jgi:LysM repeat protein